MKRSPVEQTPAAVTRSEDPLANTGRHEDIRAVEPTVTSRSRQPEEVLNAPQERRRSMPQLDKDDDDARAQTQSTVSKKERSTARSAAIILGTAAAGAVIGAVTGGGKGAAIGAASGGAGGYVYDRTTRHNEAIGSRKIPSSQPATNQDDSSYSRSPLAARFGTPGFAGR